MLLALILLIVTFVVVRYLMRRYVPNPMLANIVAAAVVLSYLAGAATHPSMFGRSAALGGAPIPAATAPNGATAAIGSIDVISGPDGKPAGAQLAAGTKVFVDGWIADPATMAPGKGAVLIVDGTRRVDATKWYGADRPDVAKAYGAPALEHSGFHGVPLPLDGLSKGHHTLTAATTSIDGHREYQLSAPVAFEVI
jgi:hypothetical protein